jgi:hypothetical protein
MIDNLKVITVDDRHTLYNTSHIGDPLSYDTVRSGLGQLLNSLPPGRGEVVVLLSGDAPDWFGVPFERPTKDRPIKDGETLQSLRAAGWTVTDLQPWTTCRKPDPDGGDDQVPAVHIAVNDWLDLDDFPLLGANPGETTEHLVMWHTRTGCAWRGTPGVAGTALLRSPGMVPLTKGVAAPRWMLPEKDVDRAWRAGELPYTPKMWDRPDPGPFRYTVDARKAYLSAWQSCLFSAKVLRPGPREFDKTLSGWWFVGLDAWTNGELPDPAGYRPNGRFLGKRWLTTPTVQLLQDLHTANKHAGFRVIESRVGHGTQLLRTTAETLKEMIMSPSSLPVMRDTAKAVYTRTGGMLARPGGRVYRPDWQAAIVAHARANQWRKIAAARAAGWLPVSINVDAITYAGGQSTMPADLAALFPQGERLGTWRYYPVEKGGDQ